jgi:hypothetical protein
MWRSIYTLKIPWQALEAKKTALDLHLKVFNKKNEV